MIRRQLLLLLQNFFVLLFSFQNSIPFSNNKKKKKFVMNLIILKIYFQSNVNYDNIFFHKNLFNVFDDSFIFFKNYLIKHIQQNEC